MPPFDYNAPAELFLAKPMKGSRTKYRREKGQSRLWEVRAWLFSNTPEEFGNEVLLPQKGTPGKPSSRGLCRLLPQLAGSLGPGDFGVSGDGGCRRDRAYRKFP
jgi:hypothetical protein